MTDEYGEDGIPLNAATMPEGSVKYCGVLVRLGRDKPCVMEPGHDGFCVFRKKDIR